MQPDPKKCDNIHGRPEPNSASELQSFLGLIQYLSPFIPNMSSKTKVLRNLLKKDVPWEWTAEHTRVFEDLKQTISSDLSLRYFDPNKPATIEVDLSMNGLGAALIQEEKPVAFSSKALTPAESRYANIERELLALVHGIEKFHTYIYGKPVIIQSDHKPLEQIQKKAIGQAPPRLQRMLLRLQPYDTEIHYKRGKDMVYADFLSRFNPTRGPQIPLDHVIHSVQISDRKLELIKTET
jgi:hypothetical protein